MMASLTPHLLWDWGTAYDLFASLHVLHDPDKFGLRGSWAAGVRSRLNPPQRTILEDAQELFLSPLTWLYNLPAPKDAASALWALGQLAPVERLPTLAIHHTEESPELAEVLQGVSARQAWNETDLERLKLYHQQKGGSSNPKMLANALEWWSHPAEFGERYLAALQAYFAVFFAEEERRIYPVLQQALERAQELATQLDFHNLVVELSQGLMIAELAQATEVVFVPSYWITPLVIYEHITAERMLLLFGGRPAEAALVPGETVPDAMQRALKALSDPTRLRILRYLTDQPLTPSQLSRLLRLRAPTVIHHLNSLRLAGLVYVSLDVDGEKRYTIREAAVEDTTDALRKFLVVRNER
jgi:DNA-binding transcriptional ArsR family regulator